MKTYLNLDEIRITAPCHARWNDMAGDEQARFCGQCSKHVFNLSAMTRVEIETLIREKEGKFCGRFYQRPDGRMLTADCPTGIRRRRNRLARFAGSVFATVMFLFGMRTTLRAQGTNKAVMGKPLQGNVAPTNQPPALLGEVSVRMGDVAVPHSVMGLVAVPPSGFPTPTNPPAAKTNSPAVTNLPVMGKIYMPPTNQSAPTRRIEPK